MTDQKTSRKNKNFTRQIILIILLFIILMILLYPENIPFLSAADKAVIKSQMQSVFGGLAGGTGSLFTLATLFSVAGICIFCWLLCWIICLILKRTVKNDRDRTIKELLISLTKFIAFVSAVIWSLSVMGVDLAALFASLGILSLIIGFGAQSLIEDTITGIFIIAEGQYNIGDIIILGEFRGVVKKIGMRTTVIEDVGGNLQIINNSDIRNMQNRSHDLSVAVCDVGTPYSMRVEDVEKAVLPNLEDMYKRNPDIFAEAPTYAGVEELGTSAVVLRFLVKCTEENIFIARRTLNREIKNCLDDHGIEIPFTQVVLHNAYKE